MAVHQNVSHAPLECLVVGAGAGRDDEKNQYSKSGDHRRPDTRVLRTLIPELGQTGSDELCDMLQLHL